MGLHPIDLHSALKDDYYITHPGPWAGHIPFAHWLVATVRPETLVELGTYRGNSYFNFCQAIKDNHISTKAFAIDTWQGDTHSGFYGDHIYAEVQDYNRKNFAKFSNLIRGTFDSSIDKFSNGTIDILHIDGLHTYDAVKQDFTKWLPKLSSRGVVLLHDITVYEGDFGVWKFFDEIKLQYPSFWFNHSNGLGIVLVGENVSEMLLRLDATKRENPDYDYAATAFARLGYFCERESDAIGSLFAERSDNAARLEELQKQNREEIAAILQDAKARQAELEARVANQQNGLIEKDVALEAMLNESRLRKAQIAGLLKDALLVQENFALFRREVEGFKQRIHHLDDELRRKNVAIDRQNAHIQYLDQHVANLDHTIQAKDAEISTIHDSTSWRSTAPLRGVKLFLRKSRTLAGLLSSGEIGKIYTILRRKHSAIAQIGQHSAHEAANAVGGSRNDIVIIATPHTLFVAYSLAASLMSYGFDVSITTDTPQSMDASLYFVVCAQMFETLPPADRRICVQLEQTVMSRWFTDRYNNVLRESLAVLEYTQNGIKFLDGLGISYPKVYHMPIGAMADYTNYLRTKGQHLIASEPEYDVVFYGDINNTRRRFFIEEIKKHFNVKIIGNCFGIDLYNELVKAKVCVNIHYYENAALESTRIFEVLSLRIPVVSEFSHDQTDYDFSAYGDSIRFTEAGNVDAMVEAVTAVLESNDEVPVKANRQSASDFHFHVGRLLLGLDKINFRRFYSQCDRSDIMASKVVLSLPETFERRAVVKAASADGTYCFPGLRARPGWIGAAYSFKYLAKKLLESGSEFVLIHEDDAVFSDMSPQDILEFAIKVYENNYKWDVFSAFISDLHTDAQISDVFTVDGIECVLTDRTVGMVCNVYNRKSLEIIAQWDESDLNVHTNTIDRYLENIEDLKVVTTIPFLAEHNEMANSSMWGVKNYTMRNMINNSRTLLFEKVWAAKAIEAIAIYEDAK